MWERVERILVGFMVAIGTGELAWFSYVFSVVNARGRT